MHKNVNIFVIHNLYFNLTDRLKEVFINFIWVPRILKLGRNSFDTMFLFFSNFLMNNGCRYFFSPYFDKMQKKRNVSIENDLPNCMHRYFAKPDMQIF